MGSFDVKGWENADPFEPLTFHSDFMVFSDVLSLYHASCIK